VDLVGKNKRIATALQHSYLLPNLAPLLAMGGAVTQKHRSCGKKYRGICASFIHCGGTI